MSHLHSIIRAPVEASFKAKVSRIGSTRSDPRLIRPARRFAPLSVIPPLYAKPRRAGQEVLRSRTAQNSRTVSDVFCISSAPAAGSIQLLYWTQEPEEASQPLPGMVQRRSNRDRPTVTELVKVIKHTRAAMV